MESLILIGTILAIHLLAWFIPGPVFVLIIRNSLVYSRKSGMWTALGIAIANIIHIMSIRIISMIAKISYNTLRTKRIRDVSISRGLVYGFAFGISIRYLVSFVSFLIVFYKLKN